MEDEYLFGPTAEVAHSRIRAEARSTSRRGTDALSAAYGLEQLQVTRHTPTLALNAMVAGLRGRPVRVVLADAHADNLEMTAESLRASGFDVTTVPDGAAMMTLLSELAARPLGTPDVVVMNLRLPYVSGLEVLAAVRAAGWTLPVIIAMYDDDDRVRAKIRQLGAAAMRAYPFDADRLRDSIFDVYVRPRSAID
jgi:CheY-like chemotaxis protein